VNRPLLFAVVSLSGASVLVLEILGTRVLGPYYGVSLFLWSALIGVTLAALAAGYAIGGRWAGSQPSGARLSLVLALAGVWVLALPWLRVPVLGATESLGLRAAMLVSALVLFFPPLMLLGMVSPYAIRLASRSVDEVGRVSGDLFALSTLASVVAAIATGYVLIPALGVSALLVVVALALFLAAALARWSAGALGAIVLLAAGAGLGAAAMQRHGHVPANVLARASSPYAELRVFDWKGFRYLTIDGSVHTIFNAATSEPRHAYVYATEIAAECSRKRGRMLLVGLGGGAAAEVYARRGWSVDAVELDSAVVRLAGQFFRFRPFHAHVTLGDGRDFIRRSHERYDVVFMDAFGGASIPFHLVTREAFAEAKRRLVPGGILAMNVEVVGWRDPLARAIAATLGSQFRHVTALPTTEPPDALGNVVLMASDRELSLDEEALGDPVESLSDDDEHFAVLSRRHAWDNRFTLEHGRVLTDDWNPCDLRAEEINRSARRWLHSEFPDSILTD
jgi:spermidine synthase